MKIAWFSKKCNFALPLYRLCTTFSCIAILFCLFLLGVECLGVPNFETLHPLNTILERNNNNHRDQEHPQPTMLPAATPSMIPALPLSSSSWVAFLDPRFDLLSQLIHWGLRHKSFSSLEQWNSALSVALPFAACSKPVSY